MAQADKKAAPLHHNAPPWEEQADPGLSNNLPLPSGTAMPEEGILGTHHWECVASKGGPTPPL
eukprot:9010648-Lingulodinium_polyedra.AAC.1